MKTKYFISLILLIILTSFVYNWCFEKDMLSQKEGWERSTSLKGVVHSTINNNSCNASQKKFLACVNAINQISVTFESKTFNPDQTFSLHKETSEKTYLSKWKIKNIDFEKILNSQFSRIEDSQKNYFYGIAFNAFLSVTEDPHSYIKPKVLYDQMLSQKNIKLGLDLGKNINGFLVFRTVPKGSVFDKKGIKKGDILISLNGQSSKEISVSQANNMVQSSNNLQINIHRKEKELFFNFSKQVIPYQETALTKNEKYNVIYISKFAKNTCGAVRDFLKEPEILGKPLVLDLRSNGGGLLDTANCLASLFLPNNSLIYFLETESEKIPVFTEGNPLFHKELFILVNGASASASELIAGTFQDHKRAIIIGQQTFGKATFQEGEYFAKTKDLAKFETKGIYLLPSGRTPQYYGVTPDVKVLNGLVDEEKESGYYSAILPSKKQPKTQIKEQSWGSEDDDLFAVDLMLRKKLAVTQ